MQGKIVQQNETLEQILCELAVRPLRFAFIVNRSVENAVLKQIYQYNTSLWGGYYNLFVPTDGHFIRNDWLQQLIFHDPDVIFYVGEIDQALGNEIYIQIQPMEMYTWNQAILENLTGEIDKIQPVLVDAMLERFFSESGKLSPEQSIVRYPVIQEGLFSPYLEIICGMWLPESKYEAFAKDALGASDINATPQNLQEYLNILDEIETRILPLTVTKKLLSPTYSMPGFGGYSIVLSKGLLDNLFIYHALRWSHISHASQLTTAIVPIEALRSADDYRLLAEWFGKKVGGNTFTIISYDVSLVDIIEFREKLRAVLPTRKNALSDDSGWVINIARCNIIPSVPQVTNAKRKQLVNVQNKRYSFEILKPAFHELTGIRKYNSKRWICDLELPSNSENKRGFVPSMFLDLNFLLSKLPERQILYSMGASLRLARGKISLEADQRSDIARFQLPTDKKIIETASENAGYKVGIGNSIYYQGMIALMGSLQAATFLHNRHILNLFSYSPLIQGGALTIKEMYKQFKISPDNRPQFETWVQTLAGKQVMLRGYNIQCPVCGLTTWYELDGVHEFMSCEGCRSSFQLPIHGDFAFRLNRLFAARRNQGSVAILLTLLLLEKTAKDGLIWQADTPLIKDGKKTEIDILAMVDGHLVIAECKNSFLPKKSKDDPELRQKKIDELKSQLKDGIEVALNMKAQLFLFASLQEDIPAEISEFLIEQDKQHTTLSVRLVTAGELINGNFHDIEERGSIFEITERNVLPPLVQEEDCYQNDKNWPHGAMSMW